MKICVSKHYTDMHWSKRRIVITVRKTCACRSCKRVYIFCLLVKPSVIFICELVWCVFWLCTFAFTFYYHNRTMVSEECFVLQCITN